MRRWLGVVLLSLAAFIPARAQNAGSPEAMKAAQELAGIMTGDTIAQVSHSVTAQLWPRIEAQFGGKVDSATLSDLRTEFESALTAFTSEVMKDTPAVYAKYFSAQELNDLIAFYHSPTGAKALKTMPMITADISADIVPRLQAFQSGLGERMKAVMERHGYK
jgi:hypothetical protein